MERAYFAISFTMAILGLASLASALLGGRILMRKRPLLVSARWILGVVVLSFVPSVVNMIGMLMDGLGREIQIILLLPVLINIVLLFFMWRQLSGYIAIGITEESCRAALLHALDTLGLPYQETLGRMRLTSLDADLQVAIQGWMGVAQLRVRQRGHAGTLDAIAQKMGERLASDTAALNRLMPFCYVVIGALGMLGAALMLLQLTPRL